MKIASSPYFPAQPGSYKPVADNRSTTSDNSLFAREKLLSKQREGLQRLASMPSARESARQAEMDKVGYLRQRLETLKALMLYASPRQLQAMAEEIRKIAGELADAARQLGGASGEPLSAGGVPATGEPEDGTVVQQALGVATSAQTAAQEAERAAQATADTSDGVFPPTDEPQLASPPVTASAEMPSTASGSGSDASLKNMLEETKRLMKEVIGLLKSRLTDADKEAREALQDAEKLLKKLDATLANHQGEALYTSLGSLLPVTANSGASSATSGPGSTIISV